MNSDWIHLGQIGRFNKFNDQQATKPLLRSSIMFNHVTWKHIEDSTNPVRPNKHFMKVSLTTTTEGLLDKHLLE